MQSQRLHSAFPQWLLRPAWVRTPAASAQVVAQVSNNHKLFFLAIVHKPCHNLCNCKPKGVPGGQNSKGKALQAESKCIKLCWLMNMRLKYRFRNS